MPIVFQSSLNIRHDIHLFLISHRSVFWGLRLPPFLLAVIAFPLTFLLFFFFLMWAHLGYSSVQGIFVSTGWLAHLLSFLFVFLFFDWFFFFNIFIGFAFSIFFTSILISLRSHIFLLGKSFVAGVRIFSTAS